MVPNSRSNPQKSCHAVWQAGNCFDAQAAWTRSLALECYALEDDDSKCNGPVTSDGI
jgi:hypothetical protein